MPALVRKVAIIAAVDGLVLLPLSHRNQREIASFQINYATHDIISLGLALPEYLSSDSLEAHGIVGLLTVASTSYLISITRRQQIAQIRGKPIFVVTGVVIIPLSSQSDARNAIQEAKESLKKEFGDAGLGASPDSDTSEDEENEPENLHTGFPDDEFQTLPSTPDTSTSAIPTATTRANLQRNGSVAEDVIGRRGQYGRFAERWFSKKGWGVDKRRMQGMSTDDLEKIQSPTVPSPETTITTDAATSANATVADISGPSQRGEQSEELPKNDGLRTSETGNAIHTLLPKLLRTTRILLTCRSFFFSYDYDITRRFGSRKTKALELPFHKSVDLLFFWNHHLALPLIDKGHHSFVLPLMQGFVGQRTFSINIDSSSDSALGLKEAFEKVDDGIGAQKHAIHNPDPTLILAKKDFVITLISRRSIMRPGLRYLRRGVDDEGNTANSVETEQILSSLSWAQSDKIYSFTQIRGSIPLYFSQSPYSFKPVPVLQHSYDTNHIAFKRHFTDISSRYGSIQIALLVDKHGGEAKIGEQYRDHTVQFNEENGINGTKLGFEWFDFHAECRGMKFENVDLLISSLSAKLDVYGTTVEMDGRIQANQSGVVRTNCMDCLDRTNVVQSACGQQALEKQLKKEGVELNLHTDQTTQWFNTLWADNGDAISKQYSSTAALKGDYTRTRKRDYRGAINDFGLTLSRYFNNVVNDYFSQAAIDYLLGNVTSQVFEEFEADMMSGDPAMSMRKVRQNAIDTSSKIVIADQSEDLLGGWALSCPREQNTVRTFPFEEAVLLLTDAALYAVRFDWNMEKVTSFERVDVHSITGIVRGTYITSILAAAQTNEQRNVGLVIKYRPGKEDVARVNTRSLSSTIGDDEDADAGQNQELPASTVMATETAAQRASISGMEKTTSGQKILAFKALSTRSSLADAEGPERAVFSEKDLVNSICDQINKAAAQTGVEGEGNGMTGFIEDKDIIGLIEAKKSTGLLEQWGHSLKKLVWA